MKYILENQILDVVKEWYIGSGSQWDVYNIELAKEQSIDNNKIRNLIYKKPKTDYRNVDENIQIFSKIKEIGLPTLLFYKKGIVGNTEVVFTENLNVNKIRYVSPNSARYSDDSIPKTEKYVMNNKINLINNFSSMIDLIDKDMRIATNNNVGVCADAYFFGFDNIGNAKIDYKIADFDNIYIDDEFSNAEPLEKENPFGNSKEMLEAFWEFLMLFVEKSNETNQYIKAIENKVAKLNNA
jgi:hypothetical protein